MQIGILGTGMVGRAHAARLVELGHTVTMGTRDVVKTLAEDNPDMMGNPTFATWHAAHPDVHLATLHAAASQDSLCINALKGEVAVEILTTLKDALVGKTLIDIANPLDFSKGMPPTLFVSNTDSLGEQIQRALPKTYVVKCFNTLAAPLQVDPLTLAGGVPHTLFISGNDALAKAEVVSLAEAYGWRDVIDLGDLATSRGTEMFLPLWLRLWGALQTPLFNIAIVK